MPIKQLIINPGSTSTKLAVYEDERKILQETIEHSAEELAAFETLPDQVPYRTELVKGFLSQHGIGLDQLFGIMGRGGMVWG
ncbi:MAG: butyrate kinase, partial [Anaerovoracaceae bacterium]